MMKNKQREQFKLFLINMAVDFNRVIGVTTALSRKLGIQIAKSSLLNFC